MTRIFLTGATGYIGGDILYNIVESHPDWSVVCLLRNPFKAQLLPGKNTRFVHGDLDSTDLIEQEASLANIVLNCANCDHVASAQAIARGLARSTVPGDAPVFWIHTSGAGILTWQNFAQNRFGEALESDAKIYDDWEHVSELTSSLPDKALHRHVDKIVLAAPAASAAKKQIKTAIVAPPAIYGPGRGTSNTKSVQVYLAAKLALSNGKTFQVGDGSNIWHEVHIRDLSKLYALLCEAAAQGGASASWNDEGYYLAESGQFRWGDVMQWIAIEGYKQGYLISDRLESVDFERAKSLHKWFPYLCGTTSRGVGSRGKKLLGWQPVERSLKDEIPDILKGEAEALELRNKQAAL